MKNFLCTIMLLFIFTLPAAAGDPSGWWSSSSGSSVHLWANMQQVVVTVVTPQKKQYKYQGYWTRFSDYFVYTVPGAGQYQAAFTNTNNIAVLGPNGKYTYWTRGKQATAPQKQSPKQQKSTGNHWNITGIWASSSGSSVQLSSKGNQIFVTIIGANGQRSQGSGRWLSQHQFDYSIPGFPGVAQCQVDAKTGRWIQVNYNGTLTNWQKQ